MVVYNELKEKQLYRIMKIKKIVFFIIIIASLFVMNSFVHSIYSLWQKNDLLVKTSQQLEREQAKNVELKEKLSYASRPQFIDEEAHNKLFFAKSGEEIVFVPESVLSAADKRIEEKTVEKPNWLRWWELFTTTP